jgi:hypothetical protein
MNDKAGAFERGAQLPPVRGDVETSVESDPADRPVPEVRMDAAGGSGRSRDIGPQKRDTTGTQTPANSLILFPFCTE